MINTNLPISKVSYNGESIKLVFEDLEDVIEIPEELSTYSTFYTFKVSDDIILYSTPYIASIGSKIYEYHKSSKISKLLYDSTGGDVNTFTIFFETEFGVICSNNSRTLLLYKDSQISVLSTSEAYQSCKQVDNSYILYSSSVSGQKNSIGRLNKDGYVKLVFSEDSFQGNMVRDVFYNPTSRNIEGKSARFFIVGGTTVGNICYLLDINNWTFTLMPAYVSTGAVLDDKLVIAGFYSDSPNFYIYDISTKSLLNTVAMPITDTSTVYHYNIPIPIGNTFLASSDRNSVAAGLYIYDINTNTFLLVYDKKYNWKYSVKASTNYLIYGANYSGTGDYGGLILKSDGVIDILNGSGQYLSSRFFIKDDLILCSNSTSGGLVSGLRRYDSTSESLVSIYSNGSAWNIVDKKSDTIYLISSNSSTNKRVLSYNTQTKETTLTGWKV